LYAGAMSSMLGSMGDTMSRATEVHSCLAVVLAFVCSGED
jgi:hypothetical protein